MKKIISVFLVLILALSFVACGSQSGGTGNVSGVKGNETASYTPDDVMGEGEYVVVLGTRLNTITLYYKDGVLMKIVQQFQKSDEEEREISVYEGDTLQNYTFNFIDWDGVPLQEILDGMKDYGGFGNYTISKTE